MTWPDAYLLSAFGEDSIDCDPSHHFQHPQGVSIMQTINRTITKPRVLQIAPSFQRPTQPYPVPLGWPSKL